LLEISLEISFFTKKVGYTVEYLGIEPELNRFSGKVIIVNHDNHDITKFMPLYSIGIGDTVYFLDVEVMRKIPENEKVFYKL